MIKKLLTLSICLSAFSSFATTDKGLNFVNAQGEGTLNIVSEIETMNVLSNLHVPKGIFMSLMDTDPEYPQWSALNGDFATDLFEIVYKINKTQNLKDKTKGIDQDIDFVATGSPERIELLKNKIEARLGAKALEYFHPIYTPELVPGGLNLDRWMQDWGEFVGYGRDANGELVSGIYYVNRNRGLRAVVEEIAMMLDLPFIESASDSESGGNYGGNIEMTPDGTLFFGDTMDTYHFQQMELPKDQQDQLITKNGMRNHAILNASWLAVGHVDEHMSVIPTVQKCNYPSDYKGPKANYGIVVADPIKGLNDIYQYKGKQKYISFMAEYNPQVSPSVQVPPEAKYYIPKIKKAIKHYLSNSKAKNFTLNDLSDSKMRKAFCEGRPNLEKYCQLVAYNIYVARIIEENMKVMSDKTACINDNWIRVPQLYRIAEVNDQGVPFGVSFLPGTANMVVLRDHLIVPQVTFDGFQKSIHKQLGKAVGGMDKVHFIMEKAEYHDLMGEVHCGTNVFRELDLVLESIK